MAKVYVRRTDEDFPIDPNEIPADNLETDAGFIGRLAHQVSILIGPGYQWFTQSLPATLVDVANHIATGSSAHGGLIEKVQQGGVDRAKRRAINVTGGGATVTDDTTNQVTVLNIPASGPQSLDIQNNGSGDVIGYVKLNFVGPTVSVVDDGSNARANIVIDGGVAAGTITPDSAADSAIIPFICTSTTRPTNAKPLFIIFESDTQNLYYNSGTSLSPLWSAISWQQVSVSGGSTIPVRPSLNVISESVSVADNPTQNRTDLTVGASPSKLTEADFLGDYVVSGFLPSAGAITQVPTGVAYVGGARLAPSAALPVTLQPSSDNYVDLTASGTLSVTSLAVGSSEPTVAGGTIRLFAGTTDATSVVASVIDKRLLRPVAKGHDHTVIDLPDSGVTAGTYDSPRVTVNQKGQVTGIASGASVVLTPATDVAIGAVLLSQVMPSGQEASPYVLARHDPVFQTRIEGLNVTYNSANSISISSGAVWIPGLNRMYNVPSAITLSSLSLTANTWYYLYLFDNGGTAAGELVTTAPAAPYKGSARAKTSDTSRRFVIALKTHPTTANTLMPFMHTGDWVRYQYYTVADGTLFNAGGSSLTTRDVSSVVPAGIGRVARITWRWTGGGGNINVNIDGTWQFFGEFSGTPMVFEVPLTSSATFQSNAFSGTPQFGVHAYQFAR